MAGEYLSRVAEEPADGIEFMGVIADQTVRLLFAVVVFRGEERLIRPYHRAATNQLADAAFIHQVFHFLQAVIEPQIVADVQMLSLFFGGIE